MPRVAGFLAIVAAVLFAAWSPGQQKFKPLNPWEMKEGEIGTIRDAEVYRVQSTTEVVIRWDKAGDKFSLNPKDAFALVRGYDTKGLIDRRKFEPEPRFKVTGTATNGKKTMHVLEPEKAK